MMDKYTRNLLAISVLAAISAPFVLEYGGPPITINLIGADGPGVDGVPLPSTAYARVQKLNSNGSFTDIAFIGSGRALTHVIKTVGTYRVVKGDTSGAFGVDISSADFALAPPGIPGPGDVSQACALQASPGDESPPFPSAYTSRTTLMDGTKSVDVIAGISVKQITYTPISPQGFDPPFPPQLPETVSETFDLMYQGVAFSVSVALKLAFPPPVGHIEQ